MLPVVGITPATAWVLGLLISLTSFGNLLTPSVFSKALDLKSIDLPATSPLHEEPQSYASFT